MATKLPRFTQEWTCGSIFRERALRRVLGSRWLKLPVFLLCLVPLGHLAWRAFQHQLTANPIEYITHQTGDWTLRFIVLTLAVTPARKLLGLPDLIRFRRMLGLFAFLLRTAPLQHLDRTGPIL